MSGLLMASLIAVLLMAAGGAGRREEFVVTEHLASKSPYRPLGDLSAQTPAPQGCFPVHVDVVARHGNRNPSSSDIEEYIRLEETLPQYREKLSKEWLKGFKNPVPLSEEGRLVLKGKYEHYNLAKRLVQAFPELWKEPYSPDLYLMKASQKERAMVSGDTFAYSLFERRGEVGPDSYEPHYILSETESQDTTLKFYDLCDLYTRTVDKNDTAKIEAKLYEEKILPRIAQRLTSVITVDASWNVSEDDALAFYSLCKTQAAILDIEDQACALFTERELLDLEYWEDLDDYYGKGYAYPINYEMTTPLMQDILYSMISVAQGETRQKANLRFAHSSTVVPLAAVFGLYKDGRDLKHNDSQELIDSRTYRTSDISTMAANFVFVLYECQDNDYLVKVLQNEKEMEVDGCDGVYCPLRQFLETYEFYINSEFDEICENE